MMTVMSESEDDLNAEEGTHYIDTLDMSRTSVYFIPVIKTDKPRMLI